MYDLQTFYLVDHLVVVGGVGEVQYNWNYGNYED